MEIAKIGVIGAGQMGSGIAQVCSLAGFDVLLNDVNETRAQQGVGLVASAFATLAAR